MERDHSYFGLLAFGPDNPAFCSLREDYKFWMSGKPLELNLQRKPNAFPRTADMIQRGIQRHEEGIRWHVKNIGEPLNASRTSSGETILWGDYIGGTLRLGDTPADVHQSKDSYPLVYTECWD
jgi:hypothetical protein